MARDSTFGDVSPVGVVTSSPTVARRLFTLSARSIVLGYLVVAPLWIVLSDRIAALLLPNAAGPTLGSTLKGWGFVAVTGGFSP
jgi:hypothetical protein